THAGRCDLRTSPPRRSSDLLKQLAYATVATLATAMTAHAAYPDRPITLVVPYPPAGTTDIAARTMAQAMEARLGQTIVVENRAGDRKSTRLNASHVKISYAV